MKTNFVCPKCKKHIRVGDKLHATYTCPNCHYVMVLSKKDISNGTIAIKQHFKSANNNWKSNNKHKFIQK